MLRSVLLRRDRVRWPFLCWCAVPGLVLPGLLPLSTARAADNPAAASASGASAPAASPNADLIAALWSALPAAADLIAERDRQLAARQPDLAIAAAQKLVAGIAANKDAAPPQNARAEDFLGDTLSKAHRPEEAVAWLIHAAAVSAQLPDIPPPARLVTDKVAAAALAARVPLDKQHYRAFSELHSASVAAQIARRPDLAKLVSDRVADAAPLMLTNARTVVSIVYRAGQVDVDLGLGVSAEARLRGATELATATLGEGDPLLQVIVGNLASALALEGKADEAETLARRAYATVSASPTAGQGERWLVAISLARILADTGRTAEAGTLVDTIIDQSHEKPSLALMQAQMLSGRARLAAGDNDGAIDRFEHAIATAAAAQGSFSFRMRPALYMARSLIEANRWLEAQKYMLGAAILLYSVDKKDDDTEKFTNGSDDSFSKRLAFFSNQFNRSANGEDVALFDELLVRFAVHYLDDPGSEIARARGLMQAVNLQADRLGFLPQDELASRRAAGTARRRNLAFADYAWMSRKVVKAAEGKRDLTEAFGALQRVQASSASQAIAQLAARSLSEAVSPQLGAAARRREELVARWRELDRARVLAIGAGPADPQLSTRIADVEREMQGIDDALRAGAPQFFAYVRPAPLAEAEAAKLFGPQEAALLIVPSEAGTHIMAVTQAGVQWFETGMTEAQVNDAVRRLMWFAGAGVSPTGAEIATWQDEVPGDNAFDRKLAYSLWQALIAPALPALKGKTQLAIAADGALASLPFAVLVSVDPQGDDNDPGALRATHWLADDFALTQVPSLQSLALLRSAGRRDAGKGFSGWGDPTLDGRSATRGGRGKAGADGTIAGVPMARVFGAARGADGAGLADIGELRKLARLPGTADELSAMARAFAAPDGSLHLEGAATERAVKAADLSGAGILAFATHGLTAGEVTGAVEPGLVLTPPATPDATDDGLLTASEVARLKLAADWVILSACNTAAGDGSSGAPGLSGLARAFFYAGARNLLVSHWPVRDDVAARLTVRTIEIARDNPDLTRAGALARAMKEIRDNPAADAGGATWATPNAWAPFTLVGDGAR
ncbi:CHAT domain-containing protein [Novosphingobium lentum]|uniref:CHAT domain-containing protein n=1 Tax=Novosphingobium lentum TaxID=145287 RepID=UPI000832AC75|nr:CHAT domain-containing protein [Novosphingobium lentum]